MDLFLLESEDLFLHRVFRNELIYKHFVFLSDAVSPVDGLLFDGGVPPRVEQENIFSPREIKPQTTRFERYQKYFNVLFILKAFHLPLTVFGRPVEI